MLFIRFNWDDKGGKNWGNVTYGCPPSPLHEKCQREKHERLHNAKASEKMQHLLLLEPSKKDIE